MNRKAGDDGMASNQSGISPAHESEKAKREQPSSSNGQLTTNKKIEAWSTVIVTASTVVMAAFTIALWWTSSEQLGQIKAQTKAMRDQLDEMKKGSDDTKLIAKSAVTQAEIALKQLDLSQRPWVSEEFEPSFQMRLTKDRWEAKLNGILSNHGESVALHVGHWVKMFPFDLSDQFGPAKKEQQQVCDAKRQTQKGFITGDIVFPKGSLTTNNHISISKNDISDKTVGFVIVGCVHYHASYDEPERPTRQTRFSYLLSVTNDDARMGKPESTKPTMLHLVRLPALWSAD